jgi:predicted nucleic acid-binding protein
VINTGPLLALMRGGVIAQLRSLPYRFISTPHVMSELASLAPDPAQLIAKAGVVIEPLQGGLDARLRKSLDDGEASVIQLALQRGVRTVCIDEKKGRRFARRRGLILTGALGLLLQLKRRKLIGAIAPVIDRMVAAGTFLSEELIGDVLAEAGEKPAPARPTG